MNDTDEFSAVQEHGLSEQYLTFLLGSEEYGIPVLDVQEIRATGKTTPIPNTAEHILGVINLRGAIVPVLDLRRRFDLPPAEQATSGVTILVTPGSRLVGLRVDSVCDVVDLPPDSRTELPGLATVIDQSDITGMAQFDERLLLLLDIESLVASGLPLAVTPSHTHDDPQD